MTGVRWLSRGLLLLALAVMLFYAVVYLTYALNLMQFPFDYDQGEGFELVDTLLLAQGASPYQSVEPYPFYASNYPPVFHLMAVPLARLFGAVYWYGRLLGFLGTLVTASAIAYAVYSYEPRKGYGRGSVLIATLAGLAFLASNIIYHLGPLLRQSMTMVMFETLAVVVLAFADRIPQVGRRHAVIALGLLLLITAGYTKQLAAYTAIAVFIWLFIRNPRRAIVCGVLFGMVGAGVFLALNLATEGEWWRQAILANVNTIKFEQVEGLFRVWFGLHGFLILPAALLVLYEVYLDRLSLYTLWFIVTTVLGGISSGTWGGGDSYFATSIAALCVLSGIFAVRTLNGGWGLPRNPLTRFAPALSAVGMIIVPLLYLGYGRAVLHLPTNAPGFAPMATMLGVTANAQNGFYDSAGRVAGGYANIGHWTTADDSVAGWRMVELVRASEKPVLSEEAAFNLLAGRKAVSNPTQLLNLWLRGLYDGSELIGMLERQDFGLIILRAQFYPEPVLIAIHTYYVQRETITMNGFGYMILYPRAAD
ncbi:MAG: hypothetical protein H7Y11_14555 [Armatimonadetes bacterium]|nr:hypothetical protein [Anaerolineae bacterium]